MRFSSHQPCVAASFFPYFLLHAAQQEKEKRLFVLTLSKMEHLKSWDSVMAAK